VKVLDAVDRGMPRAEVARTFGISLPSIKRWLKRRRETGEVDAKAPPGPPAVKGAMLGGWLPAHLRRNPDLTLGEHCEAFADNSGVKVSEATMSRAISRLPGGWPLKKVAYSFRARRGGEGIVAVAGFSLRRQEVGVPRRERVSHFHEAP
jgi:transposase